MDGQPKTLKHPAVGNLGAETVNTVYDSRSVPNYMTGGFGWGAYVAGSLWSPYGEPLLWDLGNTYAYMLNFSYQQGTRRLDKTWLLREGAAGYDLDVSYSYDDAGNVTAIVDEPAGDPVDAQCYAYDGPRRLADAWTPPTRTVPATRLLAAWVGRPRTGPAGRSTRWATG